MYQQLPDILASRLNFDVIAFRGNTRQEMIVIGLGSLMLTATMLGTLFKCCFGFFLIGVGISFPLAIPVGWVIATILQRIKADKPKGYLKQRLLLWLDNKHIKQSPFVHHSGPWLIRRPPCDF